MVAVQQIEPLGAIPRPALSRMEALVGHKVIAEGDNADVLVQGFPGVVPNGSVMAGEVTIVVPGNGKVAFQTRYTLLVNGYPFSHDWKLTVF